MPAHSTVAVRGAWGTTWRVILAAAISGIVWGALLTQASGFSPFQQVWVRAVDPALGVAALVLTLVFVRRFPLVTGLVTGILVVVSVSALGPALLALGSVATRRRWREIAAVGLVDLMAFLFLGAVYPDPVGQLPWWGRALVMALGIAVVLAVGVAMGQRRALVAGLRERAEAAEREQASREEAARVAERARIASDMHDVLAHRLSLVALHASAVGFRDDLDPADRATAMQTIEENARLALQELRGVLGVLRGSTDEQPEALHPPDVHVLVDEGRAAGMTIELVEDLEQAPPTALERAMHRIVREGLTNARKHAPGSRVVVSIAGEAGDGLAVRVVNDAPPETGTDALPGSGTGLISLRERVERLGGRWSQRPRPDGGFELSAWLPWTT
ncbi:sensor histidine kinase [Microbacterium sp. NPDC058062]|uniref:sensor histidine kinase n=1 Tax=Microbacterium sp. NPDC058062 TaxID=3346320 RepID=UPI0036D9E7EE